ncbi:calcium-independent phospholipase a2-gamma [Diplodia corticola]|uniref:Calcium-independent phospholipase a2-gamma n=1 Tax=Diplodia corticola TaxID=236234 RepID=A0A1J9RHK9_9PEZI|nr:calcium-independent phospholipase a2-gamma [Diplodia corticola]OJD32035.1 calcium-independent phospholipase a2-gamma [Diplodia corticola]
MVDRTNTSSTEQSHGSRGSNASSGSSKSRESIRAFFSRKATNTSDRRASTAKESKDKKSPTVSRDGLKIPDERNARDLLRDEHDAWEYNTVLLLGGRRSNAMIQLFALKALMSEIEKLEVRNNAQSSFDSPLILCQRNENPAGLSGAAPDETPKNHDAGYLPCHYFDFAGGTSTGGLIAILLGRLRMTVDEAITAYEDLNPFQKYTTTPTKRRASNQEKEFRERLDSAVKRPVMRLPGTMVKNVPISTKLASGPYMCKTFLRDDAGSKVDLSTCKSDDRRGEEIIDAACKIINQPKRTWVLRMPKRRNTKTGSPKSDFLMGISRSQGAETRTLERFSTKDVPKFIEQGADTLDSGADILSLLEKNRSSDANAVRWLEQIGKCAEYLVEKRQRRAQTANWERFALGTDYRCGYCVAEGRPKDPERSYDQYLLIEHLQTKHRAPPSDDDRFDTYCEILRHFRTVAVAQEPGVEQC